MAVMLRRLTEPDAAAFRVLRLRALQESPAAFGSSYEETKHQPEGFFAQLLRFKPEAPHDFFLGAFDPALIGMVGFRRETRMKTRHKGVIISMYIAPEARGHGTGRTLLEEAIAEARAQPGLEQIGLMVVATNVAAKRLYKGCGFETYGVEPRALKLGDNYYDEELMVLSLERGGR